MLSQFFTAQGRMGPRAFLRAAIVLLGLMLVVNVATVYAGPVGAIVGLASYVAPYAYFCIYTKRLHDAGHSAWYFLLFLLTYFGITGVLQTVLLPVLSPEAAALQAQMAEMFEQQLWNDVMTLAPEFARESLFTSLLGLIAANGILAAFAARLRSDPGSNLYGPPSHRASGHMS